MTTVHVVVPEDVDDPTTPSGGNVYDRRLCDELTGSGWAVHEHVVEELAGLPDGSVTLIDGLVAFAATDDVVRAAQRLRVVVLLHMPFGEWDLERRLPEARILSSAAAVVTTSAWSRRWVLDHYALPPGVVHVAEPGVDAADPAPGSVAGERLLCVAAATRDKGHQVLLTAMAHLTDLSWHLTCVGSLSRDRELAEALQRLAAGLGIADRVTWTDALPRDDLDKAYVSADLTVLASARESWGMVVTESLARGVPVLATDVGGLSEALGSTPEGSPGVLVPAGDPAAFAEAVRRWLVDDSVRRRLRTAARARRTTLTGWPVTAGKVAHVLEGVAR